MSELGFAVHRPHTSLGTYAQEECVDTETKFAQDYSLTPGFRQHIESYYKKASTEDKAKCLELLTAINIGEKLREEVKKDVVRNQNDYAAGRYTPAPPKRPMSHAGFTKQYHPLDMTNKEFRMGPHSTTYKREFIPREGDSVNAHRPASTRRPFQARYELQGKIGDTHYYDEYSSKPQTRVAPIPSGTASGSRRHNPHPPGTFMVWKMPHGVKEESEDSLWNRELTDELMAKVLRGQFQTEYKDHYKGLQQGQRPKSSGYTGPCGDWKAGIPHTLDTFTRETYQHPVQQRETTNNITRYGCNQKKNVTSIGVVPNISTRMPHMNINTRTTYDLHFNENIPTNKPRDIRDISRQLNVDALQRSYASAKAAEDKREQEKIRRMVNALDSGHVQFCPTPEDIRSSSRFSPKTTYVA